MAVKQEKRNCYSDIRSEITEDALKGVVCFKVAGEVFGHSSPAFLIYGKTNSDNNRRICGSVDCWDNSIGKIKQKKHENSIV